MMRAPGSVGAGGGGSKSVSVAITGTTRVSLPNMGMLDGIEDPVLEKEIACEAVRMALADQLGTFDAMTVTKRAPHMMKEPPGSAAEGTPSPTTNQQPKMTSKDKKKAQHMDPSGAAGGGEVEGAQRGGQKGEDYEARIEFGELCQCIFTVQQEYDRLATAAHTAKDIVAELQALRLKKKKQKGAKKAVGVNSNAKSIEKDVAERDANDDDDEKGAKPVAAATEAAGAATEVEEDGDGGGDGDGECRAQDALVEQLEAMLDVMCAPPQALSTSIAAHRASTIDEGDGDQQHVSPTSGYVRGGKQGDDEDDGGMPPLEHRDSGSDASSSSFDADEGDYDYRQEKAGYQPLLDDDDHDEDDEEENDEDDDGVAAANNALYDSDGDGKSKDDGEKIS